MWYLIRMVRDWDLRLRPKFLAFFQSPLDAAVDAALLTEMGDIYGVAGGERRRRCDDDTASLALTHSLLYFTSPTTLF